MLEPITFTEDRTFHILTAQNGTVYLVDDYQSSEWTGLPIITSESDRAARFPSQAAALEAAQSIAAEGYAWNVRMVQIHVVDLGVAAGTEDLEASVLAARKRGRGQGGGGNPNAGGGR